MFFKNPSFFKKRTSHKRDLDNRLWRSRKSQRRFFLKESHLGLQRSQIPYYEVRPKFWSTSLEFRWSSQVSLKSKCLNVNQLRTLRSSFGHVWVGPERACPFRSQFKRSLTFEIQSNFFIIIFLNCLMFDPPLLIIRRTH